MESQVSYTRRVSSVATSARSEAGVCRIPSPGPRGSLRADPAAAAAKHRGAARCASAIGIQLLAAEVLGDLAPRCRRERRRPAPSSIPWSAPQGWIWCQHLQEHLLRGLGNLSLVALGAALPIHRRARPFFRVRVEFARVEFPDIPERRGVLAGRDGRPGPARPGKTTEQLPIAALSSLDHLPQRGEKRRGHRTIDHAMIG